MSFRISRNYTLDEHTYPQFLRENSDEMDLLSFIRTADPTKVRVGERQRAEDEPKLLDTTVGRVVPLLPVAPAPGERELEDSMDRLFDEGSNGDQLRRQKKRKIVVVDAGKPSHPAKKLRDDHGASIGPFVADQTVVGARALSLSLDISHSRVQRIKENIVNNRSALHDIFVSFSEPLSIVALEGTEGTSGAAPDTTTTLSTTHASASSIPLISTDDYVVAHEDNQESTGADGQAGVGTDVNPFPNVDDAELDVSQ
ncbi:hypothetical protein Tco_0561937 [Tanacetum coccineum]